MILNGREEMHKGQVLDLFIRVRTGRLRTCHTSFSQPGRRRRTIRRLTAIVACTLLIPWPLLARQQPSLIDDETQASITRALDYLASRQTQDGSFVSRGYGQNVGVCSLVGLAFLAGGHPPDRGPHGAESRRCLEYILNHAKTSGFIVAPDAASHGPMYGHGFATLYLAEAYGVSPLLPIRSKLEAATRLIVETQNSEGGWRYQPRQADADLSVTVCQMMALRAARNAGMFVPSTTVKAAVSFVTKCQNQDGGFCYMLDGERESKFARSAAGVVVFFNAGIHDSPAVDRGLTFLLRSFPDRARGMEAEHFLYGHYYAAQAMWYAGDQQWLKWYPAIRDVLIQNQQPDGSWKDSIGSEYATAMALIILQLPHDILPIFRR